MKLKYSLASFLTLSALLGCQRMDDLGAGQGATPVEQVSTGTDRGKLSLAMSGELAPLETSEGRALSYEIVDRTGRRDGSVPDGKDYTDEFSPKLKLKEGSTHSVYLVFVREKDSPSESPVVFRTWQTFTVVRQGDQATSFGV